MCKGLHCVWLLLTPALCDPIYRMLCIASPKTKRASRRYLPRTSFPLPWTPHSIFHLQHMAFDGTIVSAQPCRPNPPLALSCWTTWCCCYMACKMGGLARSAPSMHSRCIVSCSIPAALSHAAAIWGHAELFDMLSPLGIYFYGAPMLVRRSAGSLWPQLHDPAAWIRWLLCTTYRTTFSPRKSRHL